MSSTDDRRSRLLSEFYSTWFFTGYASSLGRETFRAPSVDMVEDGLSTYYTKREGDTGYIFEFECADFAEELVALWGDRADPERRLMAQALAKLADELRDLPDDQEAVSGTLYVLF